MSPNDDWPALSSTSAFFLAANGLKADEYEPKPELANELGLLPAASNALGFDAASPNADLVEAAPKADFVEVASKADLVEAAPKADVPAMEANGDGLEENEPNVACGFFGGSAGAGLVSAAGLEGVSLGVGYG